MDGNRGIASFPSPRRLPFPMRGASSARSVFLSFMLSLSLFLTSILSSDACNVMIRASYLPYLADPISSIATLVNPTIAIKLVPMLPRDLIYATGSVILAFLSTGRWCFSTAFPLFSVFLSALRQPIDSTTTIG